MNKFKPGDVVRCIDDNNLTHLVLNKNYIIREIFGNAITLEGFHYSTYYCTRFELAYIQDFKNKLDLLIEE